MRYMSKNNASPVRRSAPKTGVAERPDANPQPAEGVRAG